MRAQGLGVPDQGDHFGSPPNAAQGRHPTPTRSTKSSTLGIE